MGPRHDLSFCACTTECLASELLVSMGPSPHLWFLNAKQRHLDQTYKSVRVPDLACRFVQASQRNYLQNYYIYGSHLLSVVIAFKTATFGAELQVSMCPRPHLSFCACKTAWFDSESLVSIVPSPHLWFLDAHQRHSNQNNKFRWVPDITCHFVLAKQRD